MDLAESVKSTHRITDWIIISSFLFIIGVILLGTIFSWDFYGVQENRRLAQKPEFSIFNLPKTRTQFEVYLNDHFGFRNTLIRRYNKLMQQYLGRKPQTVLLGDENWLFLKSDLSDYLGYDDTTKEDLERWHLVLEGRQAWLAEKGICYVFVVTPNKETIYSEHLPKEIGMSKGETRFEKLIKYMKEHSDVQILDLRPALLEAKKQRQIYFSTDTHWNGYGSFLGYQQVIKRIKNCLPEISDPIPFDPEQFKSDPYTGDLISLGSLEKDNYPDLDYDFQVGQTYEFTSIENKDAWVIDALSRLNKDGEKRSVMRTNNYANQLRAVLFHDSFMANTHVLLARHFAEVNSLWFRPDYGLLKKAVESYHPDVVIDEVQERLLEKLPKDNPEWAKARERLAVKNSAEKK